MELTRKICVEILEWCKNKYGTSKYKEDFPSLVYRVKNPPKDPLIQGEYDYVYNRIFIYETTLLQKEDPLLELIFTMIHEYKHYLQNMENYDMYIDKYFYSYNTHPYERTCDNFAYREQWECYYYVANGKKYRRAS